MSIKLIATDMDGTFLNSQKDYNRERFADLYTELKKTGHQVCRCQWQSIFSTQVLFSRHFR